PSSAAYVIPSCTRASMSFFIFAMGSLNTTLWLRRVRMRVRWDRTIGDPALAFASVVTSNCIPNPAGSSFCQDSIGDLTADNTGLYLTGSTYATTFPATAGGSTVTTTASLPQTFITKIDPTGAHV